MPTSRSRRFAWCSSPTATACRSSSSPVEEGGSFSLPYVPEETYDVFLLDGPPGAYLKSARIGGFDVLRTGFRAEGSLLPPMELEFSTEGARSGGRGRRDAHQGGSRPPPSR